MYKIISKTRLNTEVYRLEIQAPEVAKASGAGQFLIFRVDEKGERFPLTIYDTDTDKGTVTVVVQAVGVSTKKLCALGVGESVEDVTGPLGHQIKKENIGRIVCIGGGVGTAEAYPIAKAYKDAGNDVTVIAGFRNKDLVICENEFRDLTDKVYVATDDGSYGEKGFVTDVLLRLLSENEYDMVFAIGPAIMMRAVSEMTLKKNIPTRVSLNSIMVDGTGMCGCCRVEVSKQTKFACVDGPDFDAHMVDFEDLIHRTQRYRTNEQESLDHYCRIGLDKK